MSKAYQAGAVILVVDESREIRDGIEGLLTADGYRVLAAVNEREAAQLTQNCHPDLILLCMGEPPPEMLAVADNIRETAALDERVPVVIFCITAVAVGAQVSFDRNVHAISPDNFNHLRGFLNHLLHTLPINSLSH
ncbi:MAG: hypothetical protein ABR577_09745 [Pyrinomonadaceae bacterium]